MSRPPHKVRQRDKKGQLFTEKGLKQDQRVLGQENEKRTRKCDFITEEGFFEERGTDLSTLLTPALKVLQI